jgi:membrane protein implicated in regulation of membrane protease activity
MDAWVWLIVVCVAVGAGAFFLDGWVWLLALVALLVAGAIVDPGFWLAAGLFVVLTLAFSAMGEDPMRQGPDDAEGTGEGNGGMQG